ncbi:hypothetical protein HY798_01520 [Candidatus Falkowbacteria bacterium]|nr:hypothetical protein [Candidatus Falkowbacteria bacterium]
MEKEKIKTLAGQGNDTRNFGYEEKYNTINGPIEEIKNKIMDDPIYQEAFQNEKLKLSALKAIDEICEIFKKKNPHGVTTDQNLQDLKKTIKLSLQNKIEIIKPNYFRNIK